MSSLPLDLHIAILSHLPPARCRLVEDVALQTLLSYSMASSLLREAMSTPILWEPYYRTRYRHCSLDAENFRIPRYGRNWRLMYYDRRRVDKVALELIRDITFHRVGRNEKAIMLSRMGLDAWDVLDIETDYAPDIRSLSNVEPPYALTQHFWVRQMLDIIAREEAVGLWSTLPGNAHGPSVKRATFEQTMLALSAFFGKSLPDMTRLLDKMEMQCREYVQKKGLILNVNSPDYNTSEICKGICGFMISKGFGPAPSNMFFDILNHFPHAYLTSNKRTLPIALVHVFVSLARRLGLDASPINFPEKVLCYVRSPRGDGPYHVNAFVNDPEKCVISPQDLGQHLSNPHLLSSVPPAHLSQYLEPAESPIMLLRAARNILVSYSHFPHLPYGVGQSCLYLALVVHLMFHSDVEVIAQILGILDMRPVCCATLLLGKLAPLLPSPTRMFLESHCNGVLEDETLQEAVVHVRSASNPVMYFVGLPFRHRRYRYTACIIQWDVTCKASETWIREMGVDGLDRGRNQPFYMSLVLDDGATQRYIAEENIEPIPLSEEYITPFFEKHPHIAMHFQSVEVEKTQESVTTKKWRMVPSPESRASYPEDDEMGSAWVNGAHFAHFADA